MANGLYGDFNLGKDDNKNYTVFNFLKNDTNVITNEFSTVEGGKVVLVKTGYN